MPPLFSSVVARSCVVWGADAVLGGCVDPFPMEERYAVVFRAEGAEAAGLLEIKGDRLLLRGHGSSGDLELNVAFSELEEVRIGRSSSERLNGYRTLLLERREGSVVAVAPLGALLHEIADLLISLSGTGGSVLAVLVPLKPACRERARVLLAKGPPLDPASLGLSGHEVYLSESAAVFVFRGPNVRALVGEAARHPAVWKAGMAWQRCFAGPPQIADPADIDSDAEPAYHWSSNQ